MLKKIQTDCGDLFRRNFNMMQILVALLLVQNVNSFDGKSNPNFDQINKAVKVIRIINGIK
jgi:hypothetical protein